jgi:pimeloyl-ACP methyl ester carboxylesterase
MAPLKLRFLLLALMAPALALAQTSEAATPDPVRNDPSSDLLPYASMDEIAITSHGARLNGLIYLAAGPGPRPVVIFLHGYPGNEKNLDLAQAARRAGYQAVYIDYRGNWGSGGTFSFQHGLEDVSSVLDWVRTPANAEKYRMDISRIALVGHSFGGWLALMSTAREPANVCVAALDAANLGGNAQKFDGHPDQRAAVLEYFRTTAGANGEPIRANPDDLLAELAANAAEWNYLAQANGLKDHALLSVTGTRDSNQQDHAALEAAIAAAGGQQVRSLVYEDDHPFSSHRIALAETLIQWLNTDCANTQGRANENDK